MEWYYILGIIAYGVFVVQTALSMLGLGEVFDIDVDMDFDNDIVGSDIVSFKGIIHFLMGFTGWLMLAKSDEGLNILYAVLTGVAFVFVLYWIYKWCMKLSEENIAVEGIDLVGSKIRIVYKTNRTVVGHNGELIDIYDGYVKGMEVKCICKNNNPLTVGSYHIIKDYVNGFYVVE